MKNIRLHIQALGLVMVLFGSPIIHFFRDFLTIIPKSPLVMPAFSFVFFGMMLSARHFTKLYKPNYNMAVTGAIFLAYAIFLAFISPHPLKLGTELSNYIFLAVFFYLLCGVSYKISYVIMPIIVLVTLLDNFALIVSFVLNPLAHLGQRAVISNAAWGEGAGNPTLNSFMAFTGVIASMIIFNKKGLIWKIICFVNISTGGIVMLLTIVRATFLTLFLCAIAYFIFNLRHILRKNNTPFIERKFNKNNFYIYTTVFLAMLVTTVVLSDKITKALDLYVDTAVRFTSKALGTVAGGLEDKNKEADPSAANRVTTFKASFERLDAEPIRYVFGFGYRYLYVDIPVVQVLLETGLIGLSLYLLFFFYSGKYALQIGFNSNNDWLLFWVYYFILLLVNAVSRGEPYDPYFWNYFFTMARFMKPEYMQIPKRLSQAY